MEQSRYTHTYYKKYYPEKGGYRWLIKDLPSWIYLTIEENAKLENKQLVVHSKIHIGKKFNINPTYSNEFTNEEIIKDLSGKIYRDFIA